MNFCWLSVSPPFCCRMGKGKAKAKAVRSNAIAVYACFGKMWVDNLLKGGLRIRSHRYLLLDLY